MNLKSKSFLSPTGREKPCLPKPINLIKKIQEELWRDAIDQFANLDNLNSSLKTAIHNEYLGMISNAKDMPDALENQSDFWQHLKIKDSPYSSYLQEFIEIYAFKVATIYLYKLMFVITLADNMSFSLQEEELLLPGPVLRRLFKKSSSTELKCESLLQNQYSWYRPSPILAQKTKELVDNLAHLSTSQLIKLSYYRKLKKSCQNFSHLNKSQSHALSHKEFGVFINGLLFHLPQWLGKKNLSEHSSSNKTSKVTNIKFAGDRLHDIYQGHFLAQEAEIEQERDEILCADFCGEEYHSGLFIKICHELQFLSYLVKLAKRKNHPIKEFICSIMDSKYSTPDADEMGQFSLMNRISSLKRRMSYDRIVLTVIDLPKKKSSQLFDWQNKRAKQILAGWRPFVCVYQSKFICSLPGP